MRIAGWRLIRVRWLGQVTDGIFQSALASFVLFSPERQPNAASAAIAFAVVLLPYSLIGPYVGIFLDRFSRRRIVFYSNIFRALNLIVIALLLKVGIAGIVLTLFVLFAFGANRLILSGLSAGLPLVVKREELISANALAVTGGTVGVVIGGGIGIGLKKFFDQIIATDFADAAAILVAALCYLAAAFLVNRLAVNEIGPIEHEESKEIRGWGEMVEGFKMLRGHEDAIRGIFATAIQRGGVTALTLIALLLERNTFHQSNNPDAGLSGFAVVLTVAGAGIALGSFITPFSVSKLGRHRLIKLAMVGPVPFLIFFAFNPTQISLIISALFVGGFGQIVKVTNDALVQTKIRDEFRGRTFAFYDVATNAGIISGALIAASILPTSGLSKLLPLLIAAIYFLTTLTILNKTKFSAHSNSTI